MIRSSFLFAVLHKDKQERVGLWNIINPPENQMKREKSGFAKHRHLQNNLLHIRTSNRSGAWKTFLSKTSDLPSYIKERFPNFSENQINEEHQSVRRRKLFYLNTKCISVMITLS